MNDNARIDKSRENDVRSLGWGAARRPNPNICFLGRITPTHTTSTNPRIVCLMPLRPPVQWLRNPSSSASPDSRTWLLCSNLDF